MNFIKSALLSIIMFLSIYPEMNAISTFSVSDTVNSSKMLYDSLQVSVKNCALDNGVIDFDLNIVTKTIQSKKLLLDDKVKIDVIARLATANESISNFNSLLISKKISVELSRLIGKESLDTVYLNNFNVIKVNK